MRNLSLTLIAFFFAALSYGQTIKTVNVTPGNLYSALTATELIEVTNLILTGSIDARDFKTMRDDMPLLAEIDLIAVDIIEYTGAEGTLPSSWGSRSYLADEIPHYAFYNSSTPPETSLISIDIPSSIRSIGNNAFAICRNMQYFDFPLSVLSIGDGAFSSCYSLASIDIPYSITSIGHQAFSNVRGNITVDENNPNYSSLDGVLYNKNQTDLIQCPISKTDNFIIPSSVLTIGGYSFENCISLTSITVPSSVTKIDAGAFWNCKGLTSFTIPSSVTSIERSAFSQCIGLITITIPESITYIGSAAFDNCHSLSSIYMNKLEPVDLSSSSVVFNVVNKTTCTLYVPLGSKTAYESANQWQEFENIVEINLSNIFNVTAGDLSTILTPEQLNTITKFTLTGTIDARDFKTMRDEMPVLAEIDMSGVSIVQYIGTEGTSAWGNTDYPADGIPEHAFMNGNFEGKTSLTSIIFPTNMTSFGQFAFGGCHGLSNVSIPPLVNTIGNAAFYNCQGLTDVLIPTSVITIESQAFLSCRNLSSVFIPASVTTIGYRAFAYCNCLISVDETNPNFSSVDGVLFNKSQTELLQCPISKTGSFDIPSSVTSIGTHAFEGCAQLTSIGIPSSVQLIDDNAFKECFGLTSVSIPSSVKAIRSYAFANCSGLASISVSRSVPLDLSSSENVFYNIDKTTCILNVPFGSITAYQAASQWQDFTNIVEAANGFNLSANTASIASVEGSTTTIDVTANVTWAATSEQSWLTVSPASGIGENTVTFTAEANPSNGTRDAIVTVSASGVESQAITITQDGAPLVITPGTLSTLLTAEELAILTKLSLTGTIDARDFKTMRDEMPLLAEIDLRGVEITEYTGVEGTAGTGSITYPAEAIPDQAYYNKTGLTVILLPESVTSIGDYSFWGCEGLTSLVLPPLVANIGYATFNSCYRLTDIVIPNSVVSIGGQVFSFCNALYSVNIPSSVIFLGSRAFSYCPALVNVDVDNPIYSSSEGVLFNKEQTLLISYPISKTGEYYIPPTVTRIEEVAFTGYGDLTSITIPESVESIGNYAFWGQSGLSSINANSLSPIDLSSSNQVFEYVDKTTCTLYVPYGSSAAYQSANQWQDFENIVEMSGFYLSTTSALIGYAEGSTGSVDISADITWTITSDQSWLLVNPVSGTGNVSITFTATLNSNPTTRIANVTVSAVGVGSQTIVITQNFNNPPVANAGPDQSVVPGDLVTLDGSASYDIEASPITYFWTAPNGIKLSSINVVQPTFTAPKGNLSEPLIFTLLINDGMLDSQSDEVVVSVADINNPPVVICNDLTITLSTDGDYALTKNDLENLVIGTTDDNDNFNKLIIEAEPNIFSCEDVGVGRLVNVTVTDLNGAFSSCEATVSIIDETGPVFPQGSKNIRTTISPDETYVLPDFSIQFPAEDNCGFITYSQSPAAGEIYSAPTKEEISLIATDNFGNSTETIIKLTLLVEKSHKKSAIIIPSGETPVQNELKVYPNPFIDRIYFELKLTEDSNVSLELFDITGSKIETIFNGFIEDTESINFEYAPNNIATQSIFYKLVVGQEKFSGVLILEE